MPTEKAGGARKPDCILIPVKDPFSAKQRLAERLDREDRRRLCVAMLTDVLTHTGRFPLRVVVTDGGESARLAASFGCRVVRDEAIDLNSALELGTEAALDQGAGRVLILPADVPLVSGTDIQDLFGRQEQVVVAASDDGGTSALLRSPPDAIAPCYGPDSAAAHMRAAEEAGLHAGRVHLESLSLDVDDLVDLNRLARADAARQSVLLARKLLSS